MKRIVICIATLLATGVMAQEQEVQSGTPAMLEAANGKKARVFLQRIEEGKVTFQPYKSTRDYTVPADKISSLTFFPEYDAAAVEKQFNAGDYAGVVSILAPLLEPYWEYMVLDNNLRDAFVMLMDAHLKQGDYSLVRKAADILMETGDSQLIQHSKVNVALSAIAENDLPTAEKIQGELSSESAGLYLKASIERAQQRPKDAIKTIATIIVEHANDVEWLGPSELLCAYLYMDMMQMQGTNSAITTNSALHTARQVKNIYNGSHVSADAEKLWVSLGGAEREATIAAEKTEREKEKAEEEARREAEEKAKQEADDAVEDKAASTNAMEAVQGNDVSSTNSTNTTEMESE